MADDMRCVRGASGTYQAPNLARTRFRAEKMLTGVRPGRRSGHVQVHRYRGAAGDPSGRALSDGGLSPSSNNHDRLESAMFARPRVALRALIVFILATVVSTAPAHAQSWAESWFDNVTYTSPGRFEDQTRSEEHTSELQSLI